ncbi:hypothetical protein [Paraburkholderia sp. C35]|uniref:hypothetical protein n=1 Tax=Paraburkholderia sp. C35 TaxID=2126993 RepID=UPI000D69B895|nr:hypothetical protein [Paraburkholderia sp. C35]
MKEHEAQRISTLMGVVTRIGEEVTEIHAQPGNPLEIRHAIIRRLKRATDALAEARDLAIGDRETWVTLEVERKRMLWCINDVTSQCIAIEQEQEVQAAQAEAAGAVKH